MTTRVIIAMLTVLAFVAGCGGSKTSAGSSAPTQQAPQSSGLVVDITISNGTVTPADAEFKAKVGQPITFRVTSDAADELHVHSVPDHEFEVEAKPNQTFQFSVDVPGQVEVELHKLDRTVATIQVQQ
jgi:plastocyanin